MLSKTLDSFSPELMIVYINVDDRARRQLNFPTLLSPTDRCVLWFGGFDAALLFRSNLA
jgi:hypothetical protein